MGSTRKSVGEILRAMGEAQSVAVLRELAAACFANAQSQHGAANLLAENGYDGAAVALAVIGVEEFAKAILYTAAALCPSEWDVLGPECRWHELKHLIAAAAEAAQIDQHEKWEFEADYSGSWPSKKKRLEDMLALLLGHGLAALRGDPQDAREFYKDLHAGDPEMPVTPELKNAGLYVDLAPSGRVLKPARVASEVRSEILGLEWFLETFGGLPELLREEEAWRQLAQSVGEARRRPPTPQPGGSKGSA